MLDILFGLFEEFAIIKVVFLILNALYIIFLLIVFKQAKAMQAVVNDKGSSSFVNFVALVNVLIGISLFVAALVIL